MSSPSTSTGNSNGAKHAKAEADSGPVAGVARDDLVRLLLQTLQGLGTAGARAAAVLEADSGVALEPPALAALARAVLAGDWAAASALLAPALICSGRPADRRARALLLRQQYLELLEARRLPDALQLLRGRLAPLLRGPPQPPAVDPLLSPSALHGLAALAACPSPAALCSAARWSGAAGGSRAALLAELRALAPASVALPPRRLEQLVTQAWAHQRHACLYHNVPDAAGAGFGLLEDHACAPSQLPRQCVAVLEQHTDEVWAIAFSHAGTRLASGGRDNLVLIWGTAEVSTTRPPACEQVLAGHSGGVTCVAWHGHDGVLASGSLDATVRVWDPIRGSPLHTLRRHTDGVAACAFVPAPAAADAPLLLVSAGSDRAVHVWDAGAGTLLHSWQLSTAVGDLAVAPDGHAAWAVCQKRVLELPLPAAGGPRVWGEARPLLDEPEPLTSTAVPRDGRELLLAVHAAGELRSYDVASRQLRARYRGVRQARFVIRACFGGAGDAFVASGSEDSQVYVWQRAQGQLLAVLAGHAGSVSAVAWHPTDPQLLASASDDHTIRLWHAHQPQP